MARRPITTRKSKIVRVTKSEQYLVNKKYLGDEPSFTGELSKVDFINSLNWYNYMCNTDDAREYIEEHLKNIGRHEDAKKLKRISDINVPNTAAWVCRLVEHGCGVHSSDYGYAIKRIDEALSGAIENKEVDEEPKVNIQHRIKERFHDIMGEIEGIIDDNIDLNQEFSFYQWLQENSIPAVYVSKIIQKLNPVYKELVDAYKTTDEQLKEGYSHLSKPQLKKIIAFYDGMIKDAEKYADTTKKTRAPRKPRTISVQKKLKNLKFQKEDQTFKIASVNPEKIIGASELWTFNTKYKTLTVLKAKDRGGLQVKGTSVVGFDEVASKTKGTGRRTEFYLSRVKEGGKVVLRNLMVELKTDKPLAYRINENTILLRVIT